GDVRYVALALHLEDHGDGIGARNLREIGHARVPEFGVESEGQSEALRHAGAGLALDAELQRGAAAPLQREARLFQGRDRGPELVHQHGYAESARERRDASPEVTHVERTDLRQRLNAPFDVHQPGERRYGREHQDNVAGRSRRLLPLGSDLLRFRYRWGRLTLHQGEFRPRRRGLDGRLNGSRRLSGPGRLLGGTRGRLGDASGL